MNIILCVSVYMLLCFRRVDPTPKKGSVACICFPFVVVIVILMNRKTITEEKTLLFCLSACLREHCFVCCLHSTIQQQDTSSIKRELLTTQRSDCFPRQSLTRFGVVSFVLLTGLSFFFVSFFPAFCSVVYLL